MTLLVTVNKATRLPVMKNTAMMLKILLMKIVFLLILMSNFRARGMPTYPILIISTLNDNHIANQPQLLNQRPEARVRIMIRCTSTHIMTIIFRLTDYDIANQLILSKQKLEIRVKAGLRTFRLKLWHPNRIVSLRSPLKSKSSLTYRLCSLDLVYRFLILFLVEL